MEWNDSVIVLHVGRFRESDMWLRLLSRKRGLVTVFAFGGSRSRHRFCGCLDVLNTLSCRIKSSRNGQFLSMEEGVLVHGPQNLRTNWARLGMLMNCIRFLEVIGITQDSTQFAYDLMQEMFAFFEKEEQPHTLYPVLFRLRMACEQGFAPALNVCNSCAKELADENVIFYMDEGTARCMNCAGGVHTAYTLRLPANTLKAMHRVGQKSPLDWNVNSLSFDERQACFKAIDGFVQYHLGIAWDEGRFKRV